MEQQLNFVAVEKDFGRAYCFDFQKSGKVTTKLKIFFSVYDREIVGQRTYFAKNTM